MNKYGVPIMSEACWCPPKEIGGEPYPGFRYFPCAPLEYFSRGLMGIICAIWNELDENEDAQPDEQKRLVAARNFMGGAIAMLICTRPAFNENRYYSKALDDMKALDAILDYRLNELMEASMEGFDKVHAYFRTLGEKKVTAIEISKATGLSKSTVLKYANTLHSDGVIDRIKGQRGEYQYQSKELSLF